MTVSDLNEVRSTEKFLLRALVISLLIHFVVFATWKVGQTEGWWRAWSMPRWMETLAKLAAPVLPKRIVLAPQTPPLLFVQVDPELASAPPKDAKYYGAHNTVAANPEKTMPSAEGDIRGRQNEVLKTTEDAKPTAQPSHPTPPPQPEPEPARAPPKKSYVPGDLVMARPSDKLQDKEGKSDEASDQPQPQPVYHRPRTLAEAMARNGTLGEKMRQAGGVNNNRIASSLDVKGTFSGAYDAELIEAIQERWYHLLDSTSANIPGKVVLQFRLHPDGRITDMKMVSNEVTDLLGWLCEEAVLDPAPYRVWPREMRLEIPADYRDIQFTFYYVNE